MKKRSLKKYSLFVKLLSVLMSCLMLLTLSVHAVEPPDEEKEKEKSNPLNLVGINFIAAMETSDNLIRPVSASSGSYVISGNGNYEESQKWDIQPTSSYWGYTIRSVMGSNLYLKLESTDDYSYVTVVEANIDTSYPPANYEWIIKYKYHASFCDIYTISSKVDPTKFLTLYDPDGPGPLPSRVALVTGDASGTRSEVTRQWVFYYEEDLPKKD